MYTQRLHQLAAPSLLFLPSVQLSLSSILTYPNTLDTFSHVSSFSLGQCI